MSCEEKVHSQQNPARSARGSLVAFLLHSYLGQLGAKFKAMLKLGPLQGSHDINVSLR